MATIELPTIEIAASDPSLVRPAVRAFFNLARVWDLDESEQRRLLGGIGRSTLYAWRRTAPSAVAPDVMRRLSYILGIQGLLRQLFPEARPEQMPHRVRRVPPPPFTGERSLLDFMLEGGVVAMHQVRSYLVSETGSEVTIPADLPSLARAVSARW